MKKRRLAGARHLVKLCGTLSVLAPVAHAAAAAHRSAAELHGIGHAGAAAPIPASAPQASLLKVPSAADFGFLGHARPATTASPANATAANFSTAGLVAPAGPTPATAPLVPAAAAKPPATTLAPAVSVHPAGASTEVALDNTLVAGQTIPYSNGTFTITPSLGKQAGGNLFYSFGAFSLATGQTASFTGTPASPVQNVLVRVTGGQASNIDGTLASTYPGANFFFMNPSGVTFTADASLNLQGSLALTTADYVGFADGTRFSVTGATLSLAAPTAFGFLSTHAPSPILISGSNDINAISFYQPVLSPAAGSSLVVVGGNVTVTGGELAATGGGAATIAAVGSGGEARLTAAGLIGTLDVSSFSRMGSITVNAGGFLGSSGSGAGYSGPVAVMADSVAVGGSGAPFGSELGNGVGGFESGMVTVVASGAITISGGGLVGSYCNNVGIGDSGSVNIRAASVAVAGPGSQLASGAGGNAGALSVLFSARPEMTQVVGEFCYCVGLEFG